MLLEEMRGYIIAGIGECPPVYLEWMPEDGTEAVLLVEYGSVEARGASGGRSGAVGYGLWTRKIRVMVRHSKAREALRLCNGIHALLSGSGGEDGVLEISPGRRAVVRLRGLPLHMRGGDGGAFVYGFGVAVHTFGD